MRRSFLPLALVWVLSLVGRAEDSKPAVDAQQPFFTVFGQVNRQGKYDYPAAGELTISQAIALAGGFAPHALRKDVHVIRKEKDNPKPLDLRVNMEAVLDRKEIQQDIPIRPNDVIIVKEIKIVFGAEAEGKKPDPPPGPKEAPKADR